MAINTPKPISRDERYLSKIGGNEEVIVPKPISREEKYMYRAAGYDDQPIPDYPIGRNEKYWAKIVENGGGSEIGSTVTFDSGQKFISDNSSLKDYKIYGNGGEIHSTGVLPLTFTAKGGTAADWVIYGNDDNGTENLFDKDSVIQNYFMSMNGAVSSTAGAYSDYIPVQPNASYYITRGIKLSTFYTACAYDSAKTFISYCNLNNTDGAITTPSNCAYVIINVLKTNLDAVMFTAGSTAPDHYIPYQRGGGERTENLVEAKIANTNINAGGQIISNPGYNTWVAPIEQGVTYTFTTDTAVYAEYTEYPVLGSVAYNNTRVTVTKTFTATIDGYIAFRSSTNYATAMCVVGSTAPATFIPYGYQIPLIVSQQGKPDKTVDIYIGDSPLTEGETVSKTSTGVDIELFEGENTVSTTLYNKPTMEIETSYGVGVKDNNHYIIPFKVNTTTYNIQIGDSPLYDKEYLSYKDKKLYKYIDSVLTPVDPPSPFPEVSTTEGVNKVIIETSTQPNSIFITTQNPIKLVQPNIGTKTITQNGVYNASDDNLDGYSNVTVNTN